MEPHGPGASSSHHRLAWLAACAITALALALGLFARFKGLGTWPLATDEYYIARSVENVLRSGVPEYPCGGYYVRGLLYQYVLAGLRWLGLTAEYSGRLVSALCSLAALVAAYVLGRRLHGRVVGLLCVAVLAASLWEVEMARFGRMYAPFQAIALWYLVFFVRYLADRESRALLPLWLLSIAGVLTWEGGVILLALNALPPILRYAECGRLEGRQWAYIALCLGVTIAGAYLAHSDWRRLGNPLPPDVSWHVDTFGRAVLAPWTTVSLHPVWFALGIAPLVACLWALRWVLQQRFTWVTASGVGCTLLAALLHQYALVATVLLLLSLTALLDWRRVLSRNALPYHIALLLTAGYWLAFMSSTLTWRNGVALSNIALVRAALDQFVQFPDFIYEVFGPWVQTVPRIGAALLLLTSAAFVIAMRRPPAETVVERSLLLAILAMAILAGTGVAPTPETRYLFGAYAVAIVLCVATVFRLIGASRNGHAALAATLLVPVLFSASDDFHLRHLLQVDRPEFNFRQGMNAAQRSHYYARTDLRSVAETLRTLRGPNDIVITSLTGLDFYYPDIHFIYIDTVNPSKLSAWACHAGTIERWGNRPLLYRAQSIVDHAPPDGRVLLVLFREKRYTDIERALQAAAPKFLWQSPENDVVILELTSRRIEQHVTAHAAESRARPGT